jgi:putative ABC transport system permease protein
VPIVSLRPMSDLVSGSVAPRRFQTYLAMLFAGSTLLLAALGICGVVSYSVEQRRRELGVRMALGAERRQLRRMVLRQGLAPVVAGLVPGTGAALAIGRLVQSLLFGVSAYDPTTFAAVGLLVLAVSLTACYFPARRATCVDPMVALRYE